MPDDLHTALDMTTTFGPKLFEISILHAVSADCKVKVKDAGHLLLLRDWLFEELGPPYMWTVMLSVVEWEHLTDDQKELHSTMRESWLSSYSKASHTVLQTGFVPRHRCIYRAQAPRSWPQDVSQFQE